MKLALVILSTLIAAVGCVETVVSPLPSYLDIHTASLDSTSPYTRFDGLGGSLLLTEGWGKRQRVGQEGDEGRKVWSVGDDPLYAIIESAIDGFVRPGLSAKKAALKELWGAGHHGVRVILDKAVFRDELEEDAGALTRIGNNHQIRHHEATQQNIERSSHVDYLFYRILALIHLVLRETDRCP